MADELPARRFNAHLEDGIYTVPDGLGRTALAARIAREAGFASGEAICRILGVFGGWGSGKTHLLRLVGQAVVTSGSLSRTRLALFPAWRYELEGDLGVALISALGNIRSYPQLAVLDATSSGSTLQWGERIRSKARQLLELLGRGAEIAAPFSTTGAAVAAAARAGQQAIGPSGTGLARPYVDQISEQFDDLVNSALGDTADRLVILVDDLDRCAPDSMVRMFEWMKVHFRSPRCSFVVALDHKAAAHAVEGRYRQYLGDERDVSFGYRYLDKLFHLEFELADAPSTEALAITQAFGARLEGADEAIHTFSYAARHVTGTDFPWSSWLSELIQLQCLGAARTMLRIGYAYEMILVEFSRMGEQWKVSRRSRKPLPREAPFWLLFFVGMQFTLRPDDLDAFAHHQGPIFGAAQTGQIANELTLLPPEHPKFQFARFLINKRGSTGTLYIPEPHQLQDMLMLVRQKVVT